MTNYNLTQEQIDAILFYTSGKCTRINRFLQTEVWEPDRADLRYHDFETKYNDTSYKELIDIIYNILDAMVLSEEDLVVYRGSSEEDFYVYKYDDDLKEIDFTSYISTSLSESSASRFVKRVFYKLIISKGVPLIWTAPLEPNSEENEVLLSPAKFRIINESRESSIDYYTLEYIEPLNFDQIINNLMTLKEVAKDKKNLAKIKELEETIEYVQNIQTEIKPQQRKQ